MDAGYNRDDNGGRKRISGDKANDQACCKKNLNAFAIYTALLGILVLLDQFVFHQFSQTRF